MHSVVGLSEQDKCLRDDFKNWALIDIGKRLEDGVENGLLHEREAIEAHLEYLHTTMDNVLNTGHYSNVEERFRVFYAYVCALQAKFDFNQKKYDEALRCCDLGLLKGNDLENNFLGIFAKHLCTEHLSKPNPLNKIVFPTLPEPNSLSLSVPIAEIDDKKYFARFFKSKKPVILSKIVSDWLAINKWSFEYFNEQHGHRIVPVELGLKYTDDSWSQQLMTIHDYLDKYVYNENPPQMGYMAQHRLPDQIPELLDDFKISNFASLVKDGLKKEDLLTINMFMGPAGTVSPLHCDPRPNFFSQICGRKFVRLVNPKFIDKIYLNDDTLIKNTSKVDVEAPDFEKFPKFKEVICEDYIMEPGDSLYIPAEYYHYVKALEPSISLSIWFGNSKTEESTLTSSDTSSTSK